MVELGSFTDWHADFLGPDGVGNKQWGGAGGAPKLQAEHWALLTSSLTLGQCGFAVEEMKPEEGMEIPTFKTFSPTWRTLFLPLSLLPPRGHLVSSQHLGNFVGYGPPSDFLFIRKSSQCMRHRTGHLVGISYPCEPMEEGRRHFPQQEEKLSCSAGLQKLWVSKQHK